MKCNLSAMLCHFYALTHVKIAYPTEFARSAEAQEGSVHTNSNKKQINRISPKARQSTQIKCLQKPVKAVR